MDAFLWEERPRVENFAGKNFALARAFRIIKSMWKPQIASLLDFDGLGIGQVLQVLYEQKRDPTQEVVIDGNPVPRVLRYTLEVYTEEIHKVELNVYYEPPGEVLYVSWSRVGALTEDRRKVTVFCA